MYAKEKGQGSITPSGDGTLPFFWPALCFGQALLQQLDSAERVYFSAQHMGRKGVADLRFLEPRGAPGIGRYISPQRAGSFTGMEIIVRRFQQRLGPAEPDAGLPRKKA